MTFPDLIDTTLCMKKISRNKNKIDGLDNNCNCFILMQEKLDNSESACKRCQMGTIRGT